METNRTARRTRSRRLPRADDVRSGARLRPSRAGVRTDASAVAGVPLRARPGSGSSWRRSRPATRTPISTSSRRARRSTHPSGPSERARTAVARRSSSSRRTATSAPRARRFVSAHPSAACGSELSNALGLQHDVEATPKGNVIFNATFPAGVKPVKTDAKLLLDATDASGRCHDAATAGAPGSAQGGIEIVDISDVDNPLEIALTSHIGEAHTVNVDPKRPHIAFVVTSDTVSVTCDANDTSCSRSNGLNLDGFEVLDLSSCLTSQSPLVKRETCQPQVYRYRYPSALIALGHTVDGLAGCHEVEIYPDDTLTCASINASLVFDLSGAFDDRGTPNDYTDDKPRGTPLPCVTRVSSTPGPFTTAAKVVDCVDRDPVAAGQRPRPRELHGTLARGRRARRHRVPPGPRRPEPGARRRRREPRGRAVGVRSAPARHRRARRRRDAARRNLRCVSGRQSRRQRRDPRIPHGQAAEDVAERSGGRLDVVRAEARRRQGDLPRADQHPRECDALHLARLPPDSRPEPDLHGLVLAGDAGRRLRRALGRHRRVQAGRLLHPGEREHLDVGGLQDEGERRRQLHVLGRHRRLLPRRSGRSAIDVWKVTLPAPPKPLGQGGGGGGGRRATPRPAAGGWRTTPARRSTSASTPSRPAPASRASCS